MTTLIPSSFLQRALLADAVASGATGLLMLLAAGLLEGLLGLPATLLRGAGAVLIPYALFVAYVGMLQRPAPTAVILVIAANVLWAVASIALLLSGWVAPTALGTAFVIAQGAVVAVFGELQYVGLRRPSATAAA